MPLLFRRLAAGVRITRFPHVVPEIGRADFWSSAIATYRRLTPGS